MDSLPFPLSERQGGVLALGNALGAMASLLVMCDRRDIGLAIGNTSQTTYAPNVYLFDNYPGGIGLSEPLFELHHRLLEQAARMVEHCPCDSGCPSCVGPAGEVGGHGKQIALALLAALRG
jgi:DEAD/DEAH box helicase domain-containing protein